MSTPASAARAATWQANTVLPTPDVPNKLDELERQLTVRGPSVDAFDELVGRAASTLRYIAVHGAHAHEGWSSRVKTPTDWNSLSEAEQGQYDAFVQVCGALLAVATLDYSRLLELAGEELDQEVGLLDQVLDKSEDRVREPDPRRAIERLARNMVDIAGRIALIARALEVAATVDADAARIWDRYQTQRRTGLREFAVALHTRTPSPRCDIDMTTDTLWTLQPAAYLRLVHDAGWRIEQYEAWLTDLLTRMFLE